MRRGLSIERARGLAAAFLLAVACTSPAVVWSSPAPSPTSSCAPRVSRSPFPTMPPNLPNINDPDIQAAMAAGANEARDVLRHPPSPPPNLPTAPPTFAPCSVSGGLQDAIYRAAMAFVGTSTCNLHGAPGAEACMASINQILQNAGIAPIGPQPNGTNFIPDAILHYGNRLVEISQSQTVPGDLMVRHSPGDTYTSNRPGDTEHIAVCQVRGCTNVVSNSSSAGPPSCPGVFGWFSGYEMCYSGSPYCHGTSQFYRVLP